MDKQTEIIEEDAYVAIKWSEYKELLIMKGKYEELKEKESPTIQYVPYTPNIQPLTTPYPQDLTPKYTYTICKTDTTMNDKTEVTLHG